MMHGLGVGVPRQCYEDYGMNLDAMLQTLNPPFFYTWKYDLLGKYDNFFPMIWQCDVEWIARALPTMAANAGRMWLLGNEVERADQSNTPPDVFANAVRAVRREFGGALPIAVPGILIDAFDYGLDWLAAYIAVGGPLPDAWAIHVYAYSAVDWTQRLDKALAHLPGDLPVIVSECAAWNASGNAEVLDAVQAALAGGRIQAACWFSAHYTPWIEPSLLTVSGELTEIGTAFVAAQVAAAGDENVIYIPAVMR